MKNHPLPPDFADLAPFVADWALATEAERYAKLLATPLATLRSFHDAMAARAPAISAHLAPYPLGALPPEAGTLYDLLVTFIETAHPIDLKWRQTDIERGFPKDKIRFHGPSLGV
jgi:hypothetical protein